MTDLRAVVDALAAALAGPVRASEPMARHTSFRIGGPADVYAVCDTLADLSAALGVLADAEVPYTVVGKGTNVLVADAGYRGAIIVLGKEFKRHALDGDRMRAGSATMLAFLVQEAYAHGVAGMEWAAGIPGTLGGALAMNAGTRRGAIGDQVESVTLFVPGAGLQRLRGDEVAWGYRWSGLAERGVVVEAVLRLAEGDRARIKATMEVDFRSRKQSQPLGRPSAGSVFRNPPGDSAGRLIEAAGLKGLCSGDARISTVHANFIVNEGSASARDVVTLMRKAQMTVRDTYGVELQPEIRFVGSFDEP